MVRCPKDIYPLVLDWTVVIENGIGNSQDGVSN